jgi:acetylornithine deacetylase
MVRIESVNSNICGRLANEKAIALWLEETARAMGLQTQRLLVANDWWNLLVTSEIAPDRPWLLFESHMDTVTLDGMTIPPLDPLIREGRMYGRGSCDTKASGAAMLWSLADAARTGSLANNSALLFTVDEEVGKAGIKAFVGGQMQSLPWRPAAAVVGEPTLFAPVIAHNGAVRWRISTTGIPAHSSNPANGRSAISAMVEIIRSLESEYIPSLAATHPLTGRAQCSINQIQGGTQANMIPAECSIILDRRLVPGERADSVLPSVESFLRRLVAEQKILSFAQDGVFFDEPMEPSLAGPVLEWMRPALAAHGVDATPAGMPYGTDASNLTNAGVSCIVLGPGDIRQAHTTDEWVALDQLEKAGEIYGALLRSPLPARFP